MASEPVGLVLSERNIGRTGLLTFAEQLLEEFHHDSSSKISRRVPACNGRVIFHGGMGSNRTVTGYGVELRGPGRRRGHLYRVRRRRRRGLTRVSHRVSYASSGPVYPGGDRKSTRLNSSHSQQSHAVFCLKTSSHATQCLQQPDRATT